MASHSENTQGEHGLNRLIGSKERRRRIAKQEENQYGETVNYDDQPGPTHSSTQDLCLWGSGLLVEQPNIGVNDLEACDVFNQHGNYGSGAPHHRPPLASRLVIPPDSLLLA